MRRGLFSAKAEKYQRYRWDYSPRAVETIFQLVQLTPASCVVDLGAGPGNLAKHFIGRVGWVYLVEPDDEMRRCARQALGMHSGCSFVAACAEETGLPGGCADLVTAAQAIGWFDPQPARAEIVRILKPGGWLAVLRNYGTDENLNASIEAIYTPENGVDPGVLAGVNNRRAAYPISFYYGSEDFQRFTFPFVNVVSREQFIGGLATASYVPEGEHPLYPRFEAAAGEVFERFSRDGLLYNQVETELYLGVAVQQGVETSI